MVNRDVFPHEPYKLYINGEFVRSESGETFDMTNPATGEVFATAYKGGLADVEKAILAARKAFDEGPWGKMSGLQRGEYIEKAMQILERRSDEFAVIEATDCGKMFMGCKYFEVPQAVDALKIYSHEARTLHGVSRLMDGNYLNYVDYYPFGVVAEILPWNGPLMMGCQKFGGVLAAGNTVIVKPPQWASASMLAIAEVFHEAGLPAGVFNVVTGPGSSVGNALVESPLVDMVEMTGGTETGRALLTASAKTIKTLALELGGKSPNIFFEDVDIPSAAKWAVHGFTLNSGQVCVSGTRVFVQRSIYEEFLQEMVKVCKHFVPGDGFDWEKGVNFGSLISKPHADSVWEYIAKGKAEGARLLCGGEPYTDPALAKGNFVPPTIFADVTPDMTIYKEEIFGPVGCVTPFDTEEEALALANGSVYGLAGGVFSNNIKRAHRVAQGIKSGQIYVNTYFSKGMVESPSCGWKESGVGEAGIHKYMQQKNIFVALEDNNQPPM